MQTINIATQRADNLNGEGHNQINENNLLPKTLEELQILLQSESDRRVTQALKSAREKWSYEVEQRIEEEKKEFERRFALSLAKKEKELFDKFMEEIEKRERALKHKELVIKTVDLLLERRLPVEFKDFIVEKDEESTGKRLESFNKLWHAKLDEAVNKNIQASSGLHIGKHTSKTLEE